MEQIWLQAFASVKPPDTQVTRRLRETSEVSHEQGMIQRFRSKQPRHVRCPLRAQRPARGRGRVGVGGTIRLPSFFTPSGQYLRYETSVYSAQKKT